jgi:hypothetical protein
LWKKLPQHEDLFDQGKAEGDTVIDLVLEIVKLLGGGKRSGKEWEGMAKALKFIMHWAKLFHSKDQKKNSDEEIEADWISEMSRTDILRMAQDIIMEELGKCLSAQLGPDSNALKTGPNIVVIAPPGFVPFAELQKLCKRKNWDLSFKLSQRKNLRTMIRVVSPSICGLKAKHIKPHTYVVPLDVISTSIMKQMDQIIHSISNAFNAF